MKRIALAAAVVIALASTWTTATAQTSSTAQSTPTPKPPPTCLLPSFEVFSGKVWLPRRWERGEPPQKTIDAAHRRIGCAPTASHRKAMKAAWQQDRSAFYRRRHQMLAARCGSPACNINLGRLISQRRGISGDEFEGCLVPLWDRESEWDEEIWNTSGSGAGGIPQALPASKMGADANPDVGGWEVAREQIKWGLEYLADTYGGPCGGWEHSNAVNWY